jgi:arylsulfatase A-like enzyme
MASKPNLVFLLVDQLRASALPLYGETQIATPNIDRLASQGLVLDNAIATCPVCTPSRAMLVTGRHPQTTGHLMNSVRTRHSEISIGDAFANAGYQTGWVGKWHLHTGVWPALDRMPMHPDWVPEGRDRLGYRYWRAYNQHMVYFNGFVQSGDWNYERWKGYETDGLLDFGIEFMNGCGDAPFCLFLSPHQPHFTPGEFAPQAYYDRLPSVLTLPANVPEDMLGVSLTMYRHYLAMTLAIDDMVGRLTDYLERTGRAEDTILVLTSDHGTQAGSQGVAPWQKKMPYEGSIRVPGIVRFPGHIAAGTRGSTLTSMTDWFPSLCALAGIPVPRSVEGRDLSAAWRGDPGACDPDALFIMNFSKAFDWLETGMEWRGVRTKHETYVRWLDGRVEYFDLRRDPLQRENLADRPESTERMTTLAARLETFQELRGDRLVPVTDCRDWHDNQRRVVRNGYGELSHPESAPDWSLLR